MKSSSALLALAYGLLASAQFDPVTEYPTLFNICKSGGDNSYVGVLYQSGLLVTYNYGECYPYRLPDGDLADMAVFCESVTCISHPNPDCTGEAFPPVPVPLPAGTTLVNAADFVEIIGEGAICYRSLL